jgi:ABC-type transport system substrate-binding protein
MNFTMKWIIFSILLIGIILCAGCTSFNPATSAPAITPATSVIGGMPNLVGNWTGTYTGYIEETGYQVFYGVVTMKVIEQNDRLFKGQTSFLVNGTVITTDFAGVLSRDGKSFETVEYPDGFSDGVIISEDEIELIFRGNANPSRIAIDTFKRSK